MTLDDAPNTPASSPNPSPHRVVLMLTLWTENEAITPVWRGCVEAPNGRRHYFHTLAGLAQILRTWQIQIES